VPGRPPWIVPGAPRHPSVDISSSTRAVYSGLSAEISVTRAELMGADVLRSLRHRVGEQAVAADAREQHRRDGRLLYPCYWTSSASAAQIVRVTRTRIIALIAKTPVSSRA
jgi:hypothetical protein